MQALSGEPSNRGTINAGVSQNPIPTSEKKVVDPGDIFVGPHDDFYGVMSLARSVDEVL